MRQRHHRAPGAGIGQPVVRFGSHHGHLGGTSQLALLVSWKGTLVQYAGQLHRLCEGHAFLQDRSNFNPTEAARGA